jgi:hypothetical protein
VATSKYTAKDLRTMKGNQTPAEGDKTLFSNKYNRPASSKTTRAGKTGTQSGKATKRKSK